jgi:Glycosyl transferase family 2
MAVPEVSLIMAAYDPDPDWLAIAVGTALEQRGIDHELIIVDDGSREPVAGHLERLADSRLRVIRIEHGGEPAARNAGIEASRGRYLRLIDADDAFPPESTHCLHALSGGSDSVVACGATRICRADLTPIRDMRARLPDSPLIPYLLLRTDPMVFSLLIPRRVAEAVGPWDPDFSFGFGDWDYGLRVFEHASVVETDLPVCWYRLHDRQLSRNRDAAMEGTKLGLERMFERHPEFRGGAVERSGRAMLDYLAAELESPAAPWRHSSFWRSLQADPGIVKTVAARQLWPRAERLRMLLKTRPDPFPGLSR